MKRAESIPTLDDIIFEKRNKSYGAYELRQNYHSRLSKSLAVSLLFVLSVFFMSIIKKKEITPALVPITDGTIFSDDFDVDIVHPTHQNTSSPVSKPDANAFVAVVDSIPEAKPEDTLFATSGPVGLDSVPGTGGGGTDSIPMPSVPTGPGFLSSASVDKIPEFPGGMELFYAYLIKRIRYTREAIEDGLNGKMYVRFVVDEEGLITDVSVMRKVGYGLDEQVKTVLAESPKWIPGQVRNSAVKTEMILPVSFNLR